MQVFSNGNFLGACRTTHLRARNDWLSADVERDETPNCGCFVEMVLTQSNQTMLIGCADTGFDVISYAIGQDAHYAPRHRAIQPRL